MTWKRFLKFDNYSSFSIWHYGTYRHINIDTYLHTQIPNVIYILLENIEFNNQYFNKYYFYEG